MPDATPYRVMFVCSGNICRSPMGSVILGRMVRDAGLTDRVTVDSCGTGDWHVGHPAHRPTLATLAAHGYDGSPHRAAQFVPRMLAERDLVLVADESHRRYVLRAARTDAERAKVRFIREFDPSAVAAGRLEVDDPYYGDQVDYERCFAEVEAACVGILEQLKAATR